MIQWLETGRRVRCGKEVWVRIVKRGNNTSTAVTFYGNAHRKITQGERIGVGIDGGRMYFTAHQDTFKLGKYSANGAAQIILPGAKEKFVGEYNLQFDAEQKMWFIGA